jgi:hypothetical protein
MTLTCLVVYAILVYNVALYTFSYFEDQAPILKEKVMSAILKTSNIMGETYEDLKNPESAEEIAELMTGIFELLAEMGYYGPEMIHRAPHKTPSINKTYALELGFLPKAIEVLEMLPYLGGSEEYDLAWSHGVGDAEFLLYDIFVDFRDDGYLEGNKDPLYVLDDEVKGFNEDGGGYMKPDYVCLSMLGNHGAIMVLNVKNFRLWTIDQEMGNRDPALANNPARGDDSNRNSLDNYTSRPAKLALNSETWSGCLEDCSTVAGREIITLYFTASMVSHRCSTAQPSKWPVFSGKFYSLQLSC